MQGFNSFQRCHSYSNQLLTHQCINIKKINKYFYFIFTYKLFLLFVFELLSKNISFVSFNLFINSSFLHSSWLDWFVVNGKLTSTNYSQTISQMQNVIEQVDLKFRQNCANRERFLKNYGWGNLIEAAI